MVIRWDSSETVERADVGKVVGKVRKLDSGAIVVPARLTRTGIFEYKNPDGSIRRELRPAEEVFAVDSLDTLSGLPVTQGHPGMVDTNTWRQVAVGHSGDTAKQDGDFVLNKLWIQDGETVGQVESKKLVEVSMGYTCKLDMTPGETETGEKYDAVQRSIRYNHVGLGPRDWGRAGPDVRLMVDGKEIATLPGNMDPKELERLLKAANDRADAAEAKAKDLEKQIQTEKTRADQAEGQVEGLKQTIAGESQRLDARVTLVSDARLVLGQDHPVDGKSNRDLMAAVITKLSPETRTDGKSEDFCLGLFSALVVGHKAEALRAVRETVDGAGTGTSKIEDARTRMIKRNAEAKK